MAARALATASGDSAATSATASPTWRTNSPASTGQSDWISGMRFWPGMSRAVSTARTPGSPRARATSSRTMRAWAWGERSTPPRREPAKSISSM
jgi:hypothetical protein